MAGRSTWVFFSVAGAIFLLYLLFVAGVPHHTHIHINRTLANFFPDTILASGGFYPKPIYETNVAFFFGVFHFSFLLAVPIFSKKKYFQTFLQPPLATPKRHEIYEPNSPILFEIHPKISLYETRQLIHTYLHPL